MSNQKTVRVLIVEDNYLISKVIEGQLEKAGYTVVGKATNGLEAVEMTQSLRPDVVLMDVKMPEMDGIAATRRIYESCPTLVVMLTAYDTPEMVERASAAGAGAYLVKPPNVREMKRAITIAIARFGDAMALRRLNAELRAEIAERQRAEEERARLLAQIREQAQQVQQIIDTMPEGVLLLNADGPASWRIILANPVAEKDLAVLAGAHVGQALTHLGDRPLAELLTSLPKGLWHEVAADGRCFEVIARPLETGPELAEGAGPELGEGWVLVIRDVTQEREIQQRAQQQERLATVGQLAAGIAHDFNNVLTAIKGYTELVLHDLVPGDPMRADLEEIEKAAARAATLINQLLVFSRKQMLQPKVLDLSAVIANMEKMLHHLISEDTKLGTALDPSLEQIKADPGQIEQVIMNLVVNARDAMPQGGQLTLETKNVMLDEAYARQHPAAKPGAYVMLAVTDTGVGMDKEIKSHLFEPFFTTKEKGKGTGLGLATVYGIVKQSGGHIEVYSEPGVGTTFQVYLPQVEQDVEPIEWEQS